MKKLLIALAMSASLIACNNAGNKEKNEVATDTIGTGENISAEAQQSSVDTNANKIGTTPVTKDTSGKDSLPKK